MRTHKKAGFLERGMASQRVMLLCIAAALLLIVPLQVGDGLRLLGNSRRASAMAIALGCDSCGAGPLNICDRQECLSLGDCTYTGGLRGGSCAASAPVQADTALSGPTGAAGASAQPVASALPWGLIIPPDDWLGVLLFIPKFSSSDPGNADTLAVGKKALHPHIFRVDYEWSKVQQQGGAPLTWDKEDDRGIANVLAAGAKPAVTLYVGQGWTNGCPNGRDERNRNCSARSEPPSGLSGEWSPEFGYHRAYYEFVKAFVGHYKGNISLIAIENEQNSESFFYGSSEEYGKLLRTAYKAIKEADPDVRVTDGGVVGGLWGTCIGLEWESEGRPRQEIIQMLNQFYARKLRWGQFSKLVKGDIDTWPEAVAVMDETNKAGDFGPGCDKLAAYWLLYKDSIDALNFHHYDDVKSLRIVMDYLIEKAKENGLPSSIATNEIGLWQDPASDLNEGLAKDVFKKIVYAKAWGVSPLVWFSLDVLSGQANPRFRAVGLTDREGNARVAAGSFKLIADAFKGRYVVTMNESAGIFRSTFYPDPLEDLEYSYEAAWSDVGPRRLTFASPFGKTNATVFDYKGTIVTSSSAVSSLSLDISSPVLVRWKRPCALPQAPTVLTGGEVAAGQITLRWTPVPGALFYFLRVDDTSDDWPALRPGVSGVCQTVVDAQAAGTNLDDYCIEAYAGTSVNYTLRAGHSILWWVHSFVGCAASRPAFSAVNASTRSRMLTCKASAWTDWHKGTCGSCPAGSTRADCATERRLLSRQSRELCERTYQTACSPDAGCGVDSVVSATAC